MRLLNFSTGQVEAVQIGKDVVRTAHIKSPVAEPWVIGADGAVGDQRAVHPDKLYAFARPYYDYWGDYLKIDPAKWPDGFFGENLTFDALDEDDICLGDEFTLGEEVRLFVSGSRTPCVKLAWRLAQPRTFQRVFALSKRTGVYFGVSTPGRVRQGDTLRRVANDANMPSVAALCAYVAARDPPPLVQLQRILAFDRLSPTLRLLLGAKLDAAERAASMRQGRWHGWRHFSIAQTVDEAPAILSFYLRPADDDPVFIPRPGQHVSVRMRQPDGETITRSWSLSTFAHDMDSYRLTVRKQGGPGSTWLHDAHVGDVVELRAPAGDFVLDDGSFRPVVFVAAGIGITPLLAMLQAHLVRPNAAPAYLIYGARSQGDVAFADEIDALKADNPGLTIVYRFSRDGETPGRIDAGFVVDSLADLHIVLEGRRIALPWYESDLYICGPNSFCETLKHDLIGLGGNADHMYFERFTAPFVEETELETATIRFVRSGVTATWTATDDTSLLELAETAGVEIDNDCRAGACQTCRTAIIEGTCTAVTMDGTALLCLARPTSGLVELDA